jgi:hypothetical protein
MRRALVTVCLPAIVVIAAVLIPAAGDAKAAPRLGPVGVVNGQLTDAQIYMQCARGAHTGHPLRGATLTGTNARATLLARFEDAPAQTFVLKGTRPVAVPTSLELPCAGSGTVTFRSVPLPRRTRTVIRCQARQRRIGTARLSRRCQTALRAHNRRVARALRRADVSFAAGFSALGVLPVTVHFVQAASGGTP